MFLTGSPKVLNTYPANRSHKVHEGDSIYFSLEVSANPPATFKWRHELDNGTSVMLPSTEDGTRSYLSLLDIQQSDFGSYLVTASNINGLSNETAFTVIPKVIAEVSWEGKYKF